MTDKPKINRPRKPYYVPVISSTGKLLMPCHPQRARELMDKGKARPCWMLDSVFYIQLTEREDGDVDPDVIIDLDPESINWVNLVKVARRYNTK